MSDLVFMNSQHFDFLLANAVQGDEDAARAIRQEWHLQRERIRIWREKGREMNRDDWRQLVDADTTGGDQ